MKVVTPGRTLALVVVVCVCAVVAAGVAGRSTHSDQGPAPVVSAGEARQRLDAYVDRIGVEVFGGQDLRDSRNGVQENRSCGASTVPGVSWGVVPSTTLRFVLDDDVRTARSVLPRWFTRAGFVRISDRRTAGTATTAALLSVRAPDGVVADMTGSGTADKTVEVILSGPCSWPDARPDGPSASVLPPMPDFDEPIEVSDPKAACRSPEHYVFNKRARYAGKPLHLAFLADVEPPGVLGDSGLTLPAAWQPVKATSGELERARVQLLVCVKADVQRRADLPLVCTGYQVQRPNAPYPRVLPPDSAPSGAPERSETLSFSVAYMKYSVTVREAATGRRIAAFSLASRRRAASDGDCPRYVPSRDYRSVAIGSDAGAFNTAITRYIAGGR